MHTRFHYYDNVFKCQLYERAYGSPRASLVALPLLPLLPFSSSFLFLSAHSTTQTHHRERISVSLTIVLRKCERRSHTRTYKYVREHTRTFLAKRFSSVTGADNKILILLLKRHNSLPMIFIRSMNFPVDYLSET